jgi:hypothetical protein
MTTVDEFCEMLLLIAHDVPLSQWPERHRRNQFLRLVAKDYDRKEPYDVAGVKFEFQVLGQYLTSIGKQDDPLAAVWKQGRSSSRFRVAGGKVAEMDVLEFIEYKRKLLPKAHPLRGKRLKLVAGKPPS